jgi:hypothetical protein
LDISQTAQASEAAMTSETQQTSETAKTIEAAQPKDHDNKIEFNFKGHEALKIYTALKVLKLHAEVISETEDSEISVGQIFVKTNASNLVRSAGTCAKKPTAEFLIEDEFINGKLKSRIVSNESHCQDQRLINLAILLLDMGADQIEWCSHFYCEFAIKDLSIIINPTAVDGKYQYSVSGFFIGTRESQ